MTVLDISSVLYVVTGGREYKAISIDKKMKPKEIFGDTEIVTLTGEHTSVKHHNVISLICDEAKCNICCKKVIMKACASVLTGFDQENTNNVLKTRYPRRVKPKQVIFQ